jgi:16S rRNA (uracil1498-N3)-methyltransferase
MKIHRFFIPCSLEENFVTIGDFELVNQIKNVLRLKPEEYVELFNGEIGVLGKISKVEKSKILVEIVEKLERQEKKRKVILAIALLKKDNFEYAVQKAVEAGVSGIIPLKTERTIKTAFNKIRIEKIIQEASEQSGRCEIPKLYPEMTLSETKEQFKEYQDFCFDFSGDSIFEKFKNLTLTDKVIGYIGPEGGWTPHELESFDSKISLGNTMLRAETAVTVIAYMLSQYE